MEEKKIGLASVVATGVGVIVATSCLLSLGQGSALIGTPFIISMVIACFINILFVSSVSELNALMPNLTGGLAQYTLTCMGRFVTIVVMVGGYLLGNTIVASVECAMFGNTIIELLPNSTISAVAYSLWILIVLIFVNYRGINIFATVQNVVAYGLILSVVIMGIMGALQLGTGEVVIQEAVIASDFSSIMSVAGMAVFLFIASEFIIPISPKVKNARRNVPLGMVLSLLIILIMQTILVYGFKNYTAWEDLLGSSAPHVLYGTNLLGQFGMIWMSVVTIFAVVSTVNTNISSLSYLAQGMAKIELLPPIFNKTNKNGAPYIGITVIGGGMIIFNLFDLTSADNLLFLIMCAVVFMLLAYLMCHINVLILRKRLPKAPRTYKTPFGLTVPIVGGLGVIWMLWNVDSSLEAKLKIYAVTFGAIVLIGIYAFIWLKFIIKKPFFKPMEVKDVMAMENELYFEYRINKKNK